MLKLISGKLKLFKNLCSLLALAGLMLIVPLSDQPLPMHSSSFFASSKSPHTSHSPLWEYQDLRPQDLLSMKIPRPSSVASSHSGSAEEQYPASVNDNCVCCKLMHDHINAAGLSIITASEGFSSKPYRCPAGYATIGFGLTVYPDGNRVTMDSAAITEAEGKDLLRKHLDRVERDIRQLVRVSLNENEFSALCSWTFNLGSGRLQQSTLRSKLNRNDKLGAANEFPKWVRAGGRILRGLVIRREVERRLFLTPIS